jgi:hypothetical protein
MTNGSSAGSRVKGTLLAVDGKGIVRMEDRYDTSIDDLWSGAHQSATAGSLGRQGER